MTARGTLPALAIALASVLASAAAARAGDAPQVTVRLAPDPVALGEAATLEIQVTRGGFGAAEVVPAFELENLERLSGPFQAQSHKWVNGRTSSSSQLIWRLRPRAVGRARVFAVRVAVDDTVHELPEQAIDVVDAPPAATATPQPLPASPFGGDPFEGLFGPGPSARRRTAQEPKVQVRVEIDPPAPFVGQQVRYRLVLYTQTDISAFNPLGLPDFRGFWAREVPLPERARPDWVELDGERYGKVVMLQRALYPLQPGKLRLEPIEVELVLRVADAGFFGPFGRDVPKRVRTSDLTLEVRPLPSPPPGFAGIVGDLEVAAALDRERVETGQAATYRLEVESRGNLQGLAAPEIALPEGLVAYPPRPEAGEEVVRGALQSRREWSYVLVPERPGVFEIPPVRLTYFDPASQRYASVEAPARTLESVGEPPGEAPPGPEGAPEGGATAVEPLDPTPPSGVLSPLLLAAGGASAVALLVGAGYWLGRRAARPGLRPRRHLVASLARAASLPPREAADAFDIAWRQFLAERFGLAPDTPAAERCERLRAAGLAAEAIERTEAIFEEIDYLRHAPELSDVGHLRAEIVERSERLLRALA